MKRLKKNCKGRGRHTDRYTDIATTRLNHSRGQFSEEEENYVYFLALLPCEGVLIPEVVPLPPYKEESIRSWQLRWLLDGWGSKVGLLGQTEWK